MSDIEKARTFHTSQVAEHHPAVSRPVFRKFANPAPLGLFSFASTTFILSLYIVAARHVHTPNVIVGMACFSGGLAQFMAGMWEFPSGNQFGATVFTSYGAFWMSYATILIPGSGIAAAYTSANEFSQAVGLYLVVWAVLTFLFFLGSLRRNIGLIALLFFLSVTFLILAISSWNGSVAVHKAGGWLGIITAWIAFYCGLSNLLGDGESWFTLPLGVIKQDHTD